MRLIPKHLREFPHVREWNWLIHWIMVDYLREMAAEYAQGVLVDIGCGQKPYASIFAPHIKRHIGIDRADSPLGTEAIDITGDAYSTTLEDESCDTILCSEVLEHLERPSEAIREMRRILKPGGHLVLTVPFFWHVHNPPRDFYRYTEHGLRYLFEEGGFEIVELRPLTGASVTFTQLSVYALGWIFSKNRFVRTMGRWSAWLLQYIGLQRHKRSRSYDFSNLYGLVARKPVDDE